MNKKNYVDSIGKANREKYNKLNCNVQAKALRKANNRDGKGKIVEDSVYVKLSVLYLLFELLYYYDTKI